MGRRGTVTELIPKASCTLVVFAGHGIRKLLLQGGLDVVLLPNSLLHLAKLAHHQIVVKMLFCFERSEKLAQFFQSFMNCVNRGFGIIGFEALRRRCLGSMKQNQPAILLVRLSIALVRRVITHEVHEGQRVIGILHCLGIIAQREPTNASVIELEKFPIGLAALFFTKNERLPGAIGKPRLVAQILKIGGTAMRACPIGSTGSFQLQ